MQCHEFFIMVYLSDKYYRVFEKHFIYQNADDLQNRCSERFCYIHRKIPVLESVFNNLPGLRFCKFIRKRLHRRCFLVVNIVKFLRTAFIEHLWWLLLKMGFFLFKWMLINFSNFLLWEVYPSMVIGWVIHLHYISITQLAGKASSTTNMKSSTSWNKFLN